LGNWRPNIKDEGDNFLIELAVAGNADYLMTNNIGDFKNTQLIGNEWKSSGSLITTTRYIGNNIGGNPSETMVSRERRVHS